MAIVKNKCYLKVGHFHLNIAWRIRYFLGSAEDFMRIPLAYRCAGNYKKSGFFTKIIYIHSTQGIFRIFIYSTLLFLMKFTFLKGDDSYPVNLWQQGQTKINMWCFLMKNRISSTSIHDSHFTWLTPRPHRWKGQPYLATCFLSPSILNIGALTLPSSLWHQNSWSRWQRTATHWIHWKYWVSIDEYGENCSALFL